MVLAARVIARELTCNDVQQQQQSVKPPLLLIVSWFIFSINFWWYILHVFVLYGVSVAICLLFFIRALIVPLLRH